MTYVDWNKSVGLVQGDTGISGTATRIAHTARKRNGGLDSSGAKRPVASFNLGWTRAAKWLIDTVDVKGAGTYRIDMHVAWKGPGGTFRLEFNGVDRIGPINVPDTGGKSASSGDIDYLKFVKH